MRSLTGHYGALLGLDESWNVTGVELSVMEKRVVISLEFVGNGVICPECSARCSLKDHAPEREWRHLDTMQFETVLKARVPRCLCATHGVKTIAVPWADKHSRFTLMFEAFAIDVLVAAGSVWKRQSKREPLRQWEGNQIGNRKGNHLADAQLIVFCG